MKCIKTEDAVGQVLCHDITQIIRGVTKGPVFRKGHIIAQEDIPVLLSVGKENIFVWENDETMLHEDDGAAILRDISMGACMHATAPKEGKIELIADCDGLLTVDRERLVAVNSLGEMMIASRHGGFAVKKGDKLAGMRVIPLVIAKKKMEEAKAAAAGGPIFQVRPFTKNGSASSLREMRSFTAVLTIHLRPLSGIRWASSAQLWKCASFSATSRQGLRRSLRICSLPAWIWFSVRAA